MVYESALPATGLRSSICRWLASQWYRGYCVPCSARACSTMLRSGRAPVTVTFPLFDSPWSRLGPRYPAFRRTPFGKTPEARGGVSSRAAAASCTRSGRRAPGAIACGHPSRRSRWPADLDLGDVQPKLDAVGLGAGEHIRQCPKAREMVEWSTAPGLRAGGRAADVAGHSCLDAVPLRPARLTGPGPLAAAVLVTVLLLMGFGLPDDSPKQEATGTVPSDATASSTGRCGSRPAIRSPRDQAQIRARSWASCAFSEAREFPWRWACWSCQAVTHQRGVAQRPERRPPKPDAAGSTPAAPATSRASPSITSGCRGRRRLRWRRACSWRRLLRSKPRKGGMRTGNVDHSDGIPARRTPRRSPPDPAQA